MNKEDFKLPKDGLPEANREQALESFKEYISKQKSSFLGYQANQDLSYKIDLADFFDCQVNNLGDPFKDGNFKVNSKIMERAVLDYYAKLWHANHFDPDDPENPESYWGYVLSMGSSEANLYGLWNGRDYLAGKVLMHHTPEDARKTRVTGILSRVPHGPFVQRVSAEYREQYENKFSPILFYSEDTHYSVIKAAVILRIKTFSQIGNKYFPGECKLTIDGGWPEAVPSDVSGSINIEALTYLVEFFAEKGYPILINFNYGTTFKGAYDNVGEAGKALVPIFEKYGLDQRKVPYDPDNEGLIDDRTGYWFHVDGALGAAYMPFVKMALEDGLIDFEGKFPEFDFDLDFVHSISMSGHKWIGAPWPCGIYMTKKKYQLLPPDNPEYLGTPDSTFAGSRNGLSSIILWNYLAKTSYDKQIKKAMYTQRIADYAYRKLKNLENKLHKNLWVERSPLSLTIRFKKVRPDIISRYSLSGETFYVEGEKRAYNHIYAMEHATEEIIDQFIEVLKEPDAFPKQNDD